MNPEPGDIVREKESGIDYVIQATAIVAGAGAAIVFAINVFDGSIREFNAEHIGAQKEFIPLWHNLQKLSPRQVVEMRASGLARVAKQDLELLARLQSNDPTHKVFRDLYHLLDASDKEVMTDKVTRLSEMLAEGTKQIPHIKWVRDALGEIADAGTDPDFLDSLATEIVSVVQTIKGQPGRDFKEIEAIGNSAAFSEFFRDTARLVDLGFNPSLRQTGQDNLTARETFFFERFGQKQFYELESWWSHPLFKGLKDISTPAERLTELVSSLMTESGGGLGSRSKAYLQNRIQRAIESKDFSGLLPIVRGNQRLQAAMQDMHFFEASLGFGEPRVSSLFAGNQYRRKSSRAVRSRLNFTRGNQTLERLANLADIDPQSGQARILSIDTKTLINDIIRGRDVQFGGQQVNLQFDGVARTRLLKELQVRGGSPSVLATPREMRKIMASIAAGGAVDLDDLIGVNRLMSARLTEGQVAALTKLHEAGVAAPAGLESEGVRVAEAFMPFNQLEHVLTNPEIVPGGAAGNKAMVFLGKMKRQGIEEVMASTNFRSLVALGADPLNVKGVAVGGLSPELLARLAAPTASQHVAELVQAVGGGNTLAQAYERSENAIADPIANLVFDPVSQGAYIPEARAAGQQEAFFAFAGLRTKDGRPRILATEVPVPLGEQIGRARKFLTGKGYSIDIESRSRTIDGVEEQYIKEIAMVRNTFSTDSARTVMNRVRLGQSVESEAEAILQLAEHLEGISTDFAVGTHTNFDMQRLMERAGVLARNDTIAPEVRRRLEEAVSVFKQTSQHNLFGTEIIFALGGDPRLGLSQNAHQLVLGLGPEAHTALRDLQDLHKVLRNYKDPFLDNAAATELHAGPLDFFVPVRSHPEAGHFLRVHDIETASRTSRAIVEELTLKNGELMGTGIVRNLEANSPYELGGLFRTMDLVQNADQLVSMKLMQDQIIVDKSQRYARSLRPLVRTFEDALGTFDPRTSPTYFAQAEANVKIRAMDYLSRADELFAGYQKTLSSQEAANRAATMATMGMLEQGGQQLAASENQRDRVRATIQGALLDPVEREAQFGEHSFFSQLRGTLLGDYLLKNQGATHEDIPFAIKDEFAVKSLVLHAEAAKAGIVSQGGLSNARISLRLGEAVGYAGFADQIAADSMGNMVRRFTAQTVVQIAFDQQIRQEMVDQGVFSTDQLESIGNTVRRYLDTHNTAGNLPTYKQVLNNASQDIYAGIGLQGEGEFEELAWARRQVEKSTVPDTILETALQHKAQRFSEDSTESVAGKQLLAIYKAKRASGMNSSVALEAAAAEVTEDPGTATNLLELFKDQIPEQLDTHGMIRWFSKAKYAESTAKTASLIKQIYFGTKGEGPRTGEEMVGLALWRTTKELYRLQAEGRTEPEQMIGVLEYFESMAHSGVDPMAAEEAKELLGVEIEASQQSQAITKAFHKLTSMAGAAAPRSDGMAEQIQQHAAMLEEGRDIPLMNSMLQRTTLPLMALATLGGLAMALHPSQPEYSAGQLSNDMGMTHMAKYSAIPGDPYTSSTWFGEVEPFQLDMTFNGFVASKGHQEQLVSKVYDTLSSHMTFTRTNSQITDARNRSHREHARSIMERAL